MHSGAFGIVAALAFADAQQIWQGQHASKSTEEVLTANNEPEWRAMWELAGQKVPPFNEEKEFAIAIFLGIRNTGGYGVTLLSAMQEGSNFVVRYAEKKPSRGSLVTQALTTPWLIATFDRPEKPVKVEKAINRPE